MYIKKIDPQTNYHPYINHLNRVFVELIRQLNLLEDTPHFNGKKFREKVIERLYNNLVKIGTEIDGNQNFSLYYPLAPTIIISFYHFYKDEKLPKIDPTNKFQLVSIFALKFLLESIKKVEINNHDTILATNIDYIEEILAPKKHNIVFNESF